MESNQVSKKPRLRPIETGESDVTVDVASASLPNGTKAFGVLLTFRVENQEYPFLIKIDSAEWIANTLHKGVAKARGMEAGQQALGIVLGDVEAQA